MAHSIRHHASIAALITLIALATSAGEARAQGADIVEGRLTISASYGFLAQFFQSDDLSSPGPDWGHGVFLRFGGERCDAACLGISVLGSIMIEPKDAFSVGVGPHIGMGWDGPSWGGPYSFRFGAAYHWLMASEVEIDGGQASLVGTQSAHGVGAWLSLDLELRPRTNLIVPLIGIRGQYVAVVSTDPVMHHLSAQVIFGLSIGRRLVFGEEDPDDLSPEEEDELDIVEEEEDERRLRDAEDELRRMPGQRF